MSFQSEVMHCYEQTASLTDRMLAQARTGQWGELPALEAMHSAMVDRLQEIEPHESLLEWQVTRKYQLLSRIISGYAEMSGLVRPQLAHLGQTLQRMEQQQTLYQAYGSPHDANS